MLRTIFAKSGLSTALTSEQLYLVADAAKGGSLLGIEVDETADEIKLYFKDNGNEAANEVLTLDIEDGKGATAAEEIIAAINGLAKNAQVFKVSDEGHSVEGVNGVQIPDFTIASTAVALDEDAGPTLGTATVGAEYSVTITKDSDADISLTVTGVIDAASDVLEVFSPQDMTTEGFAASDVCTVTVVLTSPNQPSVSKTVTAAATLTAS